MNKLELPIELEEHREALEKSVKPYIKITEHERETTPYQSKLGGYPYYPKDLAYPVSVNGEVMRLLVQLNFNEMPHLEGFPTEGILQIYVPFDDENEGYNFGFTEVEHKVVYHKEITQNESRLMTVFPYLNEHCDDFLIKSELSLSFELKEEIIPHHDLDADRFIDSEDWDDDMQDTYGDFADSSGIKVGGYPVFTQQDPRENTDEYDILLFQLDSQSDGDADIHIGDAGVMNFFINSKQLANCDFTNVFYNWDCL